MYKEQDRYNKAEQLLLEPSKAKSLNSKLSDTHPHTLASWDTLIELYEAWDKPEKAREWRAKLPQMDAVEK